MIKFIVPSIPVAQPRQRHRIVGKGSKAFVSNYTPAKDPVNAFKATARLSAREAFKGVPPHAGAVFIRFSFVMPRTKSQIWKSKPMPRLLHTKKPDIDNLEKSILDALSGLVWIDDCQIVDCHSRKCIASGDESPHVVVEVEFE